MKEPQEPEFLQARETLVDTLVELSKKKPAGVSFEVWQVCLDELSACLDDYKYRDFLVAYSDVFSEE